MKLADVAKWLEGTQDYSTGVELLEHFSNNKFLIRILKKGPTEFNRDKLEEALQLIAKKNPEAKKKTKGKFEIRSAEQYDSLPEKVRKLTVEKDAIYKEMSFLHSQLELYKTDKERGAAALRVLDLDDQVKSIWKKLDYYEVHGKLPSEPEIPEVKNMAPAEMMQRRNSLRSYISRTPKGTGKDDEIEAWIKEREQLDKLLEA